MCKCQKTYKKNNRKTTIFTNRQLYRCYGGGEGIDKTGYIIIWNYIYIVIYNYITKIAVSRQIYNRKRSRLVHSKALGEIYNFWKTNTPWYIEHNPRRAWTKQQRNTPNYETCFRVIKNVLSGQEICLHERNSFMIVPWMQHVIENWAKHF